MEKDFSEALDTLLDSWLGNAADRAAAMDETVSALELKLMALKEQGKTEPDEKEDDDGD